jgi:tRNA-2-methylthio-N6-dimethylallyladenosine synthase
LDKVAVFREQCPGWALTTDLIVGFPSETEDDFAQTLHLCERVDFAQAFMFVYSPRRGTPAALWEQVPAEIGSERLRRLNATVDRSVRAFHAAKVGTTVRALAQGPSRKDPTKIAARTSDNVTIVAAAGQLGEAAFVASPWVDVAVEEARVWGCSGRLIGLAQRFDGAAVPVRIQETVDLLGGV